MQTVSVSAMYLFLSFLAALSPPGALVQGFFAPLTLSSAVAPWDSRASGAVWTAGSSIYVAGGFGSSGYLSDVWVSADQGVTWSQLASISQAVWGSAGVSFRGTNYIFGGRPNGCGDSTLFWSSPVGSSGVWTANNSPWGARARAAAVVWIPPPSSGASQQMLFLGGTACNVGWFNDVWSSTDGINWQTLGNAPFVPVAGMGYTTIQQSAKVILAGGFDNGAFFGTVWMGAWSGVTSGLAWYQLTTSAPWTARAANLAATSDDIIVLVSGMGNPASGSPDSLTNDVWASQDGGFTWTPLALTDPFSARIGAGLVSQFFELILFGGSSSPGSSYTNDVWVAWTI